MVLIPGDGIGPEVTAAARRVIDATGVPIDWQEFEAGGDLIDRLGTALPQATLDAVMDTGLALKGPIATPIGSGHRSVNVEMRRRLDLFANFRPTKSLPGNKSRYEGVDLIIVRENTEGLYSGLEHIVVPGVVESLRVITESASDRIVRYAFDTARRLQPQGSPQNRPTKVTSKPANEGGPGPGCFTATCRDRASLFWYANSVGHT